MVTDKHVRAIEAHSVCQVKFDNQYVYTASYDNTAASWVIETGRLHCRYIGHFNGVLSVEADKDKKLVITGSADSTIKLWHLDNGRLLESFSSFHSGWIKQVEFLHLKENSLFCPEDSFHVIVLSSDAKGKIVLWTVLITVMDSEETLVQNFRKIHESNCLNQPVITNNHQICISGRVSKSNNKSPVLSFYSIQSDIRTNTLRLSLEREVTLPEFLPNNGKLIGSGERFAVFHVTEEMGLCTNSYICVLDMEMGEIFSTVQVPHER